MAIQDRQVRYANMAFCKADEAIYAYMLGEETFFASSYHELRKWAKFLVLYQMR